jgi:hypothetical protein
VLWILSRRPNASLTRQGMPVCSFHTTSLGRQHCCLTGGWRPAPSLRTSSRLRESPRVPGRVPSNCSHFNFEQGQAPCAARARTRPAWRGRADQASH